MSYGDERSEARRLRSILEEGDRVKTPTSGDAAANAPRTAAGREFMSALHNADIRMYRRRPIAEWIADIEAEAATADAKPALPSASPEAEGLSSRELLDALEQVVEAFGQYHTSSVLNDGSYGELVKAMNKAETIIAASKEERP